jgi:hypothetical protein
MAEYTFVHDGQENLPFVAGEDSHKLYTTYVRLSLRNARTHHLSQRWVPIGQVCIGCRWSSVSSAPRPSHRQAAHRPA